MLTEAQKRAKQKYIENNRERTNYINDRSKAKNFILKKATLEDLKELEELIKERRENEYLWFNIRNVLKRRINMKKKVYTIQLYDKYRFNLEKIIIIAINEEDALEKLKKSDYEYYDLDIFEEPEAIDGVIV